MSSLNEILSRLPIKGVTEIGGTLWAHFLPILNSSGVLDPSLLSEIAKKSNIYKVANQAARLALTNVYAGDIAIETNTKKSYALCNPIDPLDNTPAPSDNNNWALLGVDLSNAVDITFSPAGSGLTATDVQAAIVEVASTAIHTASAGTQTVASNLTVTGNTTLNGTTELHNTPGQPPFVINSDNQNVKVIGLNADKLDGEDSVDFHNAANLTGTVAPVRLSGEYNINVHGDVRLVKPSPVNADDAVNKGAMDTAISNAVAAIGSPAVLGSTNPSSIDPNDAMAVGISVQAARADHQHQAPPLVTPTVDGFARATDKARFDFCDCGGFDDVVNKVYVKDNSVYVGGKFKQYGNIPSPALARLDFAGNYLPNFKLDPLWTGTEVNQIAAASDGVFVGSDLTDLGAAQINRIKSTGDIDTLWCLYSFRVEEYPSDPIKGITALDDNDTIAYFSDNELVMLAADCGYNQHFTGTNKFTGVTTSPALSGAKKLVLSSYAYTSPGTPETYQGVSDPQGLKMIDFRKYSLMTFAAIGDYGFNGLTNTNALGVANMLKSKTPEFIVSLGDQNYNQVKSLQTYDNNVGKYFQEYIYPYKGVYGVGNASKNLFWPIIGNHEANNLLGAAALDQLKAYFYYFKLPNNERYYDRVFGDVHAFFLNSDKSEPDGFSGTSRQHQWFRDKVNASTATWKIVFLHHSPYSSEQDYDSTWMRDWNFTGINLVMSGHAHEYERLQVGSTTFIVNGGGGRELRTFGTPLAESLVRYNADYSGCIFEVSSTQLVVKAYNKANVLVDTATINNTEVVGELGDQEIVYRLNAGSGAESACFNPIISPDGKFIIAGNSLGYNSTNTSWNSKTGNLLKYSEELSVTPWASVGTPVVVTDNDSIDPFGRTKSADKISDNDGVTLSYVHQDVTITATAKTYKFNIYVLKDTNESRFPVFKLKMTGGSTIEVFGHLNTKTGATTLSGNIGTGANGAITSSLVGNYWKVTITASNTNNTLASCAIYPAYAPTFGGSAVEMIGSIVCWGAQLRESTWSEAYIHTTSTTVSPLDRNSGRFQGLYKINTDGTEDLKFDCDITVGNATDSPIPFAIDSQKRIYFGGNVTAINGIAVTPWRLYRIKENGFYDKEFNLFNNTVNDAKLLSDNTIVVGGAFTHYGSNIVGRIVYLYADGTLAQAIQLSDDMPTQVGVADYGNPGESTAAARSDHQHPTVGLATEDTSGFMSDIDKLKLDQVILQDPVTFCDDPLKSTIPNLTSNILPVGYIASASTNSIDAWKAFSGIDTNQWDTGNIDLIDSVYPHSWIQIKTPTPRLVQSYIIKSDSIDPPLKWTFLGSNDGSTWTQLDTRFEPSFTVWTHLDSNNNIVYNERQYDIPNEDKYSYYRLDMENNEQTPVTTYKIIIKSLKLVDEFPSISTALDGQELCLDVKLRPDGGISSSPFGLEADFNVVAKKNHTHAVASAAVDGFMSKEDKIRFDMTESGGFDGDVNVITINGNNIYVGGDFNHYHNIYTPKLAKLNDKAEFDFDFDTLAGFDKEIQHIAFDSASNIYVAGNEKLKFNNGVAKHITKIKPDGSEDLTFVCPATLASVGSDIINDLKIADDRILVLTPRTFRVLNSLGASVYFKESSDTMHAMATHGPHVYIAAKASTQFDGDSNPNGIRKISITNGVSDSTFDTNGGVGSNVDCANPFIYERFSGGSSVGEYIIYAVNTDDGVGTQATWSANGAITWGGLGRIDLVGNEDTDFDAKVARSESSYLQILGPINRTGELAVIGPVNHVNAVATTPWRVYKLDDTAASVEATFDEFNDKILAGGITVGGKIVVGGSFTSYGKRSVGRFAILDSVGQLVDCCAVSSGLALDELPQPIINPPTGYASVASPLTVTISKNGFEGATLLYTIDGTDPASTVTGSTLAYAGPITVTTALVIKAKLVKSGWTTSQIAIGRYYLKIGDYLPSVVFDPPSGALTPLVVHLTVPGHPSAAIFYTTDGTTPATSVTGTTLAYNPVTGITVSTSPTTLKAIATEASWSNSPVSTAFYGSLSVLSIDFGGTSLSKVGLAADGIDSSDKWNFVNTIATTEAIALNWVNGSSSNAKLLYSCYPAQRAETCSDVTTDTWAVGAAINDPMMRNAVVNTDPNYASLDRHYIRDIPGGKYDIYVYSHGPLPIEGCTVTLKKQLLTGLDSIIGVKSTTTTDSGPLNYNTVSWTEDVQYVKFADVELSEGQLLSWRVDGHKKPQADTYGDIFDTFDAYLNGMQLVRKAIEQLVPVTFNPLGGSQLYPVTLTLSHVTPGVDIYYTLDGSTPIVGETGTNFKYLAPFVISTTPKTVKAIAAKVGYRNSAVHSETYSKIELPPVTFDPPAGTYPYPVAVTLASTEPGVAIFYTTDGTNPATAAGGSTFAYTGVFNITVDPTTVKTVSTKTGWKNSSFTTAVYQKAQVPVVIPDPTPCEGITPTAITLTCNLAGVSIFYTLDTTTPNTFIGGSTLAYTGPFTLLSSASLKAIASKTGYRASNVTTWNYSTQHLPEVRFTPSSAVAIMPITGLVIDVPGHLDAVLTYTTDGTDPRYSSTATVYTTPININGSSTTVLRAFARKGGYSDSCVHSETYPLPVVASVQFSPTSGTPPLTTTLTTATSGASIYYTIDGTNPISSGSRIGPVVSGATQSITVTTTVKAYATKTNYNPAPISSITYSAPAGSVEFFYLGRNSDRAGSYSVFGPGDSIPPSDPLDWEIEILLNVGAASRELRGFMLYSSDITGTASGGQLMGSVIGNIPPVFYPLVVYKDGVQLNHDYVNSLGTYTGEVVFRAYGQPAEDTTEYLTLIVKWADGSQLVKTIAKVISNPPLSGKSKLINIDFASAALVPGQPVGVSKKIGPAAVGEGADDFWNALESRNGHHIDGLKLADGTLTSDSVSVLPAPSGNAKNGSFANIGDYMFDIYAFKSSGEQMICAIDIELGTYNFYIYAHGAADIEAASITLYNGSESQGVKSTASTNSFKNAPLTQSIHYVKYGNVVVTNQVQIVVKPVTPGQATVLNGIQIQRIT